MLRAFKGLPHIAPVLLVALLAPASASAQAELELPAPAGSTSVRAVAIRAELNPRPDGAAQAVVSLTVLNPEAETQDLLLAPGGPGAVVTRAGEPVRQAADGTFKLRLEAAEVAVLQVDRRVAPADLSFLAAEDAGWLGEARGPLLQPVRRLSVSHPAGSPWSRAALEVRVSPGGQLLACSLLASPGALASEDGSVSWSYGAGQAPKSLGLAWPTIENETFLPVDEEEARVFERHWSTSRGLSAQAVRLVRAGILAVHGEALDDERARRAFDSTKRPGWAPIPGPPTRSEREAAAALAAFADRLELAGAPRVVASATQRPTPAEPPPPSRPAVEPAASPRQPAVPPSIPARRADRASARPAPDLEKADDSELVTLAGDPTWRSETLLRTEASVPNSPERARRWARRALRGGHGLSRAVIARESVPALHGKTWAPGFVAEFFSQTPWYRPNPDYDFDDLSPDEQAAWGILDSLIGAVRDGTALAPDEPEPVPQIAQRLPVRTQAGDPEPPPAPAVPTPEVEPAPPAPRAADALRAAPGDDGPAVPWLQNPAQARIFVFKEKARGLETARVALAIATIEARHGRPFDESPELREYFDGTDWYRPQADYGPERLSIPARESITLLRNALDTRTY